MTIPFKTIPGALRVPLFYAEVDNSRANTAQEVQRGLILGHYTSGNVGVVPNVPYLVSSVDDVRKVTGSSSILSFMAEAYRKNDPLGELWILPVAEDVSAAAATGSVQFTASATAAGTFYLYVGGVRYALPVSPTQTTSQLATALAALINSRSPTAPVNATVSTNTVTLIADNKGPSGNEIDIRANYAGAAGGEVLPTGLAVTITAMSGGATAPSLTTALSNCGERAFDFIVTPWTDTTTLNALRDFLSDASGRWSYAQQLYGHFFYGKSGTLGTLTTFGSARNDQHATCIGHQDSATPAFVWAAAFAGAAAASLRNDPALPLQTLAVSGVLAPPLTSRFVLGDRNTLLYSGISTYVAGDDGAVRIDNLITTYQKNAFGAADNSYLEVETMFTLAYVLRFMKTAITSKFSRVKLASNAQRIGAGANVVTPNVIRAELIAQYRELESRGYVQNVEDFKAGLVVEQNATNPNRVDVLWPGTLINQLRIFALLAQFRLN